MSASSQNAVGPENALGTGIVVTEIDGNIAFHLRRAHLHNPSLLTTGMERLATTLVEDPDRILQQLVECAVDLCGADTAGVSVLDRSPDHEDRFRWVATAGRFERYVNALTPIQPSACGVALERNRPQTFTVDETHFLLNNIESSPITDGLLIPWHCGETHGTIWIAAHGRTEAFDLEDLKLMTALARFASLGVAQQELKKIQYDHWTRTASSAMGHLLARQIHAPLQALAQSIFIAASGKHPGNAQELANELSGPLSDLTEVVEELLGRPSRLRPN